MTRLWPLMRSPRFRLRGLVALAIIAVGGPGTDVRHGMAHDFAREHLAVDRGTELRLSHTVVEHDHQDEHPHLAVDYALRERVSPADFGVSAAPSKPVARLVAFNQVPGVADAAAPRSDHSTGPPPRLRAPPVS